MRYDSGRKLQRNQDLVEYRDKHKHDAWREIGERYGIRGPTARTIYMRTVATNKLRAEQG